MDTQPYKKEIIRSIEYNVKYSSRTFTHAVKDQELISSSQDYDGSDIKFLDDSSNWFPWQKYIMDLIYDDKKDEIRPGIDRRIIWI